MGFSPHNLKSYICTHVFEKTRPILLVAHEGGDWMFMCGAADHEKQDWHVVGIGHLTERDPTIHDCADLPDGFEAERKNIGSPWLRTPIDSPAS